MQKRQDVIINSGGQPVGGATVLVRPTGLTSTAVIYATNTGTSTAANPVTADYLGRFSYYGTNGRYDEVISGSYIQTTTNYDVMLEDVPLTNLGELSTASNARSNLGLGSAAVVSTATFAKAANNLSDLASTATARINLGLGTSTGTVLHADRNLADISTAATARSNLGLAIGTNVQAFNANAAFTTGSQTFTGGQRGAIVVLASTGQIAPDFAAANNFSLAMTVNTTLAAASNVVPGQSGFIGITQNSTAKTLAFNTFWKFAAGAVGTLSTATSVGTTDVLRYNVLTTTSAEAEMRNGVA